MNYTAKKNTAIATGSADYAIILQNIYDEQMKNPVGVWVKKSAKEFSYDFPRLSEKQIRTCLGKLESYGLIGSRLENSMQRTKIYWVELEAYYLVR